MLLHLVRHGPPLVDEALPASHWHLDPQQLTAVDRLGASGVLPREKAVWFSSPEPKAVATAARLHPDGEVIVRDELREATRPAGWFGRDAFVASVTRSLELPDHPAREGWETTASVRVRMFGVLRGDVARHAEAECAESVVLVGHGTAWTVLAAALTDRPPDLVAWRAMGMPDHCMLELSMQRDDDWSTPRPWRGDVLMAWGGWQG